MEGQEEADWTCGGNSREKIEGWLLYTLNSIYFGWFHMDIHFNDPPLFLLVILCSDPFTNSSQLHVLMFVFCLKLSTLCCPCNHRLGGHLLGLQPGRKLTLPQKPSAVNTSSVKGGGLGIYWELPYTGIMFFPEAIGCQRKSPVPDEGYLHGVVGWSVLVIPQNNAGYCHFLLVAHLNLTLWPYCWKYHVLWSQDVEKSSWYCSWSFFLLVSFHQLSYLPINSVSYN